MCFYYLLLDLYLLHTKSTFCVNLPLVSLHHLRTSDFTFLSATLVFLVLLGPRLLSFLLQLYSSNEKGMTLDPLWGCVYTLNLSLNS